MKRQNAFGMREVATTCRALLQILKKDIPISSIYEVVHHVYRAWILYPSNSKQANCRPVFQIKSSISVSRTPEGRKKQLGDTFLKLKGSILFHSL
mmetsp:Transcript_5059/g.5946  ORF Transcript_5059/g.5946 Transcript_5059/m.5946 type:complete len:95 (+) Transcript_5059:540-824(+)